MSKEKVKNEEVVVEETTDGKRTFTEELEVAGGQLIERVQEVIKAGNVRRIIIRSADDNVILETSLTVGAVAGGLMLMTPLGWPLAVLGAIAAAVKRVKIEIVREVGENDHTVVTEGKKKIDIETD